MKKKIYFFVISYFIFLGLSVVSCVDTCGGPYPDKYKVIGLDWNTYEATYSESNNSLDLSEILQNSVIYSKFSIVIYPIKEAYFSSLNNSNSISLISSAYACSPVPPETNDNLENIEIFANNDFNSTHLIGTNLADIFDVIIYDDENSIYYEKYDLETYLVTKPKVPTEMTLLLKVPPTETSDFIFTIKYYQNGKDIDYLEIETNTVEIKI